MPMLHDPGVSEAFKRRVQSLTPETKRVWGRMSIDQMLWHVNLPLAEALGDYTAPGKFVKFAPEWLIRWVVLNLPWGHGAPTRPDMKVEGERYEFAKEKQRCLDLLDRFTKLPLEREWPRSANFGMTGRHWSRLQYKHLDHHLGQFGV